MLRVLNIFGTRPEAIKMAPVIQKLNEQGDKVQSIVCVTGQHRQMLDQVLSLFHICPDYDLNLMQPNQSLAQLTSNLLTGLDSVVQEVKPDWILAQGDTTSVMVAGIIAYYHRVRFGHIEAGLRTGDRYQPFPEEMNRRIADSLADTFFAPTERARLALLQEGYPDPSILVTGNTVVDALLSIAEIEYDWSQGPVPNLTPDQRIVLVTAHRRESFGAPMRSICLALRDLAQRFENQNVHFVYPVHLNPNVRKPVQEILSDLPNIHLIEPVDYVTFVNLMKRSTLILTDSGGVQEEAPSFGVPVLVMRDTTERPEGVEAKVVKLIGTQYQQIVSEVTCQLEKPAANAALAPGRNPYGDGKASERIVQHLLSVESRLIP